MIEGSHAFAKTIVGAHRSYQYLNYYRKQTHTPTLFVTNIRYTGTTICPEEVLLMSVLQSLLS